MTDEPVAKKRLGQHWLHDETVLDAMCDAANIVAGDVVLEVGPGTGELTQRLLDRKAEVVALEVDESLYDTLNKRFANYKSHEFFLQQSDVRTYNFDNMPGEYKLVANIPYYLTSYLMRLLTDEATHKPIQAALLMQKEVVERITATPGNLSLLAVITQLYWEVSAGIVVPARLFTPPPKVDSQILIMKKRSTPLFPDIDRKLLIHVIKAGFSAPRKTIQNTLSAGLRYDKNDVQQLLMAAKIDPTARAQTLTLDDWHRLAAHPQKPKNT